MKTITLNLYTIKELDQDARQKAFDDNRFFNVDDNFWYESVLDDFCEVCRIVGVDLRPEDISFSGFSSQVDGSTFELTIDVPAFIRGIRRKLWKGYAPNLDFEIPDSICNHHVMLFLELGLISTIAKTKRPGRGYWLEFSSEYDWSGKEGVEYPNIIRELEKMESWLAYTLKIFNKYLYRSLEEIYNYYTSDQSLKDAFEANEYLFTADGKMADNLLKFTVLA